MKKFVLFLLVSSLFLGCSKEPKQHSIKLRTSLSSTDAQLLSYPPPTEQYSTFDELNQAAYVYATNRPQYRKSGGIEYNKGGSLVFDYDSSRFSSFDNSIACTAVNLRNTGKPDPDHDYTYLTFNNNLPIGQIGAGPNFILSHGLYVRMTHSTNQIDFIDETGKLVTSFVTNPDGTSTRFGPTPNPGDLWSCLQGELGASCGGSFWHKVFCHIFNFAHCLFPTKFDFHQPNACGSGQPFLINSQTLKGVDFCRAPKNSLTNKYLIGLNQSYGKGQSVPAISGVDINIPYSIFNK